MKFTRRSILKTAACAPLSALAWPSLAISQVQIGDATLTTVSDGHLVLPKDLVFDAMPQEDLAQLLSAFDLRSDQLEPECNLTLYQDGTRTVLFDAGSGPDFMPTAGRVLDSLSALAVSAQDITHLVFTHAHPDHIWGTLDDFGDPLFSNALHLMGQNEWDYWWNPQTVDTIGSARQTFAVGAKNRMTALEDRFEFFQDGQELLPGIQAIESPGHTPGHMSFEVRQGTQAVFVTGDAIGNHHIAFRRPMWPSGSDQDVEQAIATRQRLFDRIIIDDLAIAGFHLPNGGVGRVEAVEDGYRFVQDPT
ncbi:MBL fold metallo-hydrolase [Loktanella sp. SALINAS62]|uniref:MBL fold metallo-hydrolase n=1 Tax=Loktanella sp. SALINAS62 TaxID=2706124 RepID=UPI001B8D2AC8|nr:MBL fold metallo-hydrolase [Loktanella sp. SALINAS62]MBS1302025.1 MBL fold metallo-hydrolase [Loktanella sp. SALINAS62]